MPNEQKFEFGEDLKNSVSTTPSFGSEGRSQLEYPLDPKSETSLSLSLNRLLPEKILDIFWNNIYYYQTIFDFDTGGWDDSSILGATANITPDGLLLQTGADSSSLALIRRSPIAPFGASPAINTYLSFREPQRLRCNFALSSITQQQAYIRRGTTEGAYPFYGFRIDSETLKGVCRDSTINDTEVTVNLDTALAIDRTYMVEARLLPAEKVVFYVVNRNTQRLEEKGVLTTSIPKINNPNNKGFVEFELSHDSTVNKQVSISLLEYIQLRNRFGTDT